jgi:hypothetical protein
MRVISLAAHVLALTAGLSFTVIFGKPLTQIIPIKSEVNNVEGSSRRLIKGHLPTETDKKTRTSQIRTAGVQAAT